jgi:hypothetical protein
VKFRISRDMERPGPPCAGATRNNNFGWDVEINNLADLMALVADANDSCITVGTNWITIHDRRT